MKQSNILKNNDNLRACISQIICADTHQANAIEHPRKPCADIIDAEAEQKKLRNNMGVEKR